jgi:hypothetical protein
MEKGRRKKERKEKGTGSRTYSDCPPLQRHKPVTMAAAVVTTGRGERREGGDEMN